MTEYKGVLEISDYAQSLINSGQARIEGSNVVWNSGSGGTGIVEWGKFRLDNLEDGEDSGNLETMAALIGGVTIGVVVVGALIYKGSKDRQAKVNKINNNLISCLSLYILEAKENKLQPSTRLDLKFAIKEYIDNVKLFKNKIDLSLLKNIDIILNDLELRDDMFELNDSIIQLKNVIDKNYIICLLIEK